MSTLSYRFETNLWHLVVEIAKEINRVLLKMTKLKWFKIQNHVLKIAKIKRREICEPQNHEINVSWKVYVIS